MVHWTLFFIFPGEKKPYTAPIHEPSDDKRVFLVGIVVGPIVLVLVAIFVGLFLFCWQNG